MGTDLFSVVYATVEDFSSKKRRGKKKGKKNQNKNNKIKTNHI